ncbi:MAG TPA: hypothetical protein VLU73_09390 [Methylococcaceae bacterium]|nr:hypothetical protein [Methylococcaceae bacterium]
MAIQHWRHLWRNASRGGIFSFSWPIIRRDSYVVITVSEANLSAEIPGRFIGLAKPMVAANIAPQDGVVEFVLWWSNDYGSFSYLNVWTDITVFDPNDPHGTN